VASFKQVVSSNLVALTAAILMMCLSAAHASQTVAAKKKASEDSASASPTRPAHRAPQRASKKISSKRASVVKAEPVRLSFGELSGLHNTVDALALKSSVALVLDQDTNEVLFAKNSDAVLPIASLTKLMTALVVTEAQLPLDEVLSVTQDDVDTEKFSHSRLKVGTQLSREEMLHLALMSSENRAAHALGRNYPGGIEAFVSAMNAKAQMLGMHDTRYVEPTGLSSKNQSSAQDLATLVKAAHEHQIIREMSTSPEYSVEIGNRPMEFRTTNALVRSPSWDIGLQKTGFINEAGRCLVMQAKMAGRQLIMVFLDSAGKYSRIADAERVRRWINTTLPALPAVPAALPVIAPPLPAVAPTTTAILPKLTS
jgi:D-alanyl-D-alanine endopeptidase (penicillin-binding protein 7)